MRKERLQRILDSLPDHIDLDALIARLSLLRHLELAEEEIALGKTIDHEAVEKKFETWLR